jgi:hypothetical protein
MDYKGLLDMIDGGGAGRAGQQFEGGGLLSAIANMVATPYGSQDRMRPQARPDDFRQRFTPPIQPAQPMQQPMSAMPPPVTTTTLPPVGAMPTEELMRMLQIALSNYGMPSGIGYGPR